MTSCPTYDELFLSVDPAQGTDNATLARVRTHMDAGCPSCARRESRLSSMLSALRSSPFPEVPKAWRNQAVALLRSPGPIARVRDFLARLIVDVNQNYDPAMALRGEGPADRHLLFEAGPFEVDLALLDSGALVGQVAAEAGDSELFANGFCVLHGQGKPRETRLDVNGDFHFAGVSPGHYNLVLESPAVRVLVPQVDLTEAEDSP